YPKQQQAAHTKNRRPHGAHGHGPKRVMKNLSKSWKQAPTLSKEKQIIPQIQQGPRNGTSNKLRIAVLGGTEEVGCNMTMIEYGNDIIIIDCGLQFPDEDMPGIDYIIPNVSYLKGKEKNIRGMIITHAHLDHIGAIPHIAPMLHNPPIFSARLTLGIIAKRQDDFPDKPRLDLREVDIDGQLKLGDFVVEFIRINHSVPDSLAIVVRTPEGMVIHTGDFKFDLTPIGDQVTDYAKLSRLGNEGVLALLADSTNASKPGHQLSERYIGKTIEEIIEKAEGRVIVSTFASNLNRVQQLLWAAEDLERYVVLEGYSMKTNVEIAKQLGYLTVNSRTIITPQEAVKLPPHKVMIVGTGAQGEGGASLMRIATGEHRFFRIEKGDTIIFSSSVIPGNERTVQALKDTLLRLGAKIIHYQMMDVHAGGHAQQEDLKLLLRMVKPKYYVPIEGHHDFLHSNAGVARELGWEEDKLFITSNGQVIEFAGGAGRLTQEKLPADYVMVDGLGVGDVSEVVLRDRQLLAADGIFVVIITIDGHNGKVIGSPDIMSRGFIYMKGNKTFVEEARKKIVEIVQPKIAEEKPNGMYLKNKLRDELGEFLFKKIQRRPMILPVVIEV
ncbi:MAG TPA: ribonuclease J, partial [Patescibacteria group bacterium]|nr:ribonuclease J [Patescibacteria group bacterium]